MNEEVKASLQKGGFSREKSMAGALFLLIVLIEAGFVLFLIHNRLLVGGSDGFKYFYLQYYFLNNVVNSGEIPLWCPFLTHGSIMTWWYIYQGSVLQDFLLLTGSLLKGVNFLPLYYAGIFLDQLLLLVGTWLLGRRVFTSILPVFFVALSIMGSAIWMTQTWWNFHFYYAIPLILYLLHVFLDTGKWRYCFLAANLLFVQALGGLPYFLPVTTLFIFLYFLFHFSFDPTESRRKIGALKWGWPFITTVLVTIVFFSSLYGAMKFGTDQIYIANRMRKPDGSVPLDVFLTYAGHLNWPAWLEMAFGISPALDYTLYIGVMAIPFILLGVTGNFNRRMLPFCATAVALLLFSMGTFLSVIVYYGWPMMKFFRHLILVVPIGKVLLCFLAGFGLEALLLTGTDQRTKWQRQILLAIMALIMVAVFAVTWTIAVHYPFDYQCLYDLLERMIPEQLPPFLAIFQKEIMILRMSRTAVCALAAAVVFAVLFFLNQKVVKTAIPRWRSIVVSLLALSLVIHCADMYVYKASEIGLKTVPLNETLYKNTEFQAMPYPVRRDLSYAENNPRAALLQILPLQCGVLYWTTNAFLFKDQLGNQFKTDDWLLPLDQYMRAFWGQPINNLSIQPKGLVHRSREEASRLVFPKQHPAALKISGVTEDKVQFFSQARVVASANQIASYITDPDYQGNAIFLSPLKKKEQGEGSRGDGWSATEAASSSRLRPFYRVRRFDSNHLEITVQINSVDSAWLLYSDVWHPNWRATVNGKQVPVYKANLAYKAVRLEKGFNQVHFYFTSAWMTAFHFFAGINSLFWIAMVLVLSGRIVLRRDNSRGRLGNPGSQDDVNPKRVTGTDFL